jgi:hypothetical protein
VRLPERLDIEAEKWTHEPGDKLYGRIIELGTYSGEYGSSETIALLVNEEGATEEGGKPIPLESERIFYASRTVPARWVAENTLSVGDWLGVKYKGVPNGKEYHDYRFVHEPAQPTEGAAEPETSNDETQEAADDEAAENEDDGIPY